MLLALSVLTWAKRGLFSADTLYFFALVLGPEKPSEQDSRLIIPVVDRLCCCFQAACRRFFWCKVDHDNKVYDDGEDESVPVSITIIM